MGSEFLCYTKGDASPTSAQLRADDTHRPMLGREPHDCLDLPLFLYYFFSKGDADASALSWLRWHCIGVSAIYHLLMI